LPPKKLTPHEKLIKGYEYFDCNMGINFDTHKVANLLRLASEVPDPKWTTRKRINSILIRLNGGDVYDYNSIVSFLHSHGWIDEAFLIFDKMRVDEIVPNLMSYNSLINCYLYRQDYQNAAVVLEDIRKAGLVPSTVTWATLFKGYADTKQLSVIGIYLPELHKDNIDPAFAADVEALAKKADPAGISKRCEEAIHQHLTEEEAHHKEAAAMH